MPKRLTGGGEMSERRLTIGKLLLQQMLEHCLEEKPYEACGILVGRAGTVHHAYATANSRRSKVVFEVDAAHQAIVLQRLMERGEEMIGIYHSHPTSPAWPSATDIEQAVYYPDAIRMIISLQGPAEIGAFLIRNGRVVELPITVGTSLNGEFHDLRLLGPHGLDA